MDETFKEYLIRNMTALDLVDVLEIEMHTIIDKMEDDLDWERLKQFTGWEDSEEDE